MANLQEEARVKVSVNGEEARKELEILEVTLKDLREELHKASGKGKESLRKRLRKEIKSTERDVKRLKKETYDVGEAMKTLDSASPKELRKTLSAINRQLNSGTVKRNSDEWKELTNNARLVRGELSKIWQEQKAAEPAITRFTNSIKQNFAGILTSLLAIRGLGLGVNESISTYTSIEESLTDVRKYTDLTKAELDELQSRFSKMDTRITREQLNALAGEAGRLGITGVEDIYAFVYAADQLNMALGDDLGEEGVKNIGKLALMFGEDQAKGLQGAMLATGSAINEVAQASSASEPYLVEFTSRLGGVAKTANISQANVMGFASVLDQNMQSVERSSTALQNVILRMTSAPAKFAEIAGVEVGQFTELLKNDANAALIQFLEGLRGLGDLTDISPVLKDLQLSGSGMASTLTVLAGKLEDVQEAQSLANDSYDKGTSVLEEAALVNNTAQAQLDKRKNALREEAAIIGEKLLPVRLAAMDGSKQAMRLIGMTVKFLYENRTALITLIAAIGAYKLAVQAATIQAKGFAGAKYLLATATNAFTGNLKRATVAFKAFTRATKANPFGVLLAAIVAVVGSIKYLNEHLGRTNQLTRDLAKMSRNANRAVEEEKTQIEALYKVAIDDNAEKEKRLEAIKKLNEISPDYLGGLDLETIKTKKATEAIRAYTQTLTNQELAKRAVNSLADVKEEYEKWLNDIKSSKSGKRVYEAPVEEMMQSVLHRGRKEQMIKEEKEFQERIEEWTKIVDSYTSKALESKPKTTKVDKKDADEEDEDPIIPTTDATELKEKERLKQIEEWLSVERAKVAGHYANGLIDKAEYDSKVQDLDLQAMQERIELYAEGSSERAKEEEKLFLKQAELNEKLTAQDRKRLAAEMELRRSQLGQDFINNKVSLESYNQQLFNIELEYQQKLSKTYEQGSKERADIEKKIQDMLLKDKQSKLQEFERMKSALLKQYSKLSADETRDMELQALDYLHAQKLLSEEEFLKAKKDLEEKYREDVATNFLDTEEGQLIIEKTQFGLAQLQTIMGGFNNYMMAATDAQVASVERKYEAEIKAAGNNQFKLREIEERKQKEIQKVKAKAADKALIFQMAMAMAQAVQGSINAYTSTAAIPIIGPKLAPIAAGIAMAAGMLNVAAIKKQQAAAKKGFAKGGYTGSGRWDEEKGVVHADEFVANRHAVKNPAVRPVLDFIDTAQRNNTIGSITAEDISRRLYPQIAPVTSAPAGEPKAEGAADVVHAALSLAEASRKLTERLNEPFQTINTVEGDYGIKKALKDANSIERIKSR